MSKVVVFRNDQRLHAYFAPLEKELAEQGVGVIYQPISAWSRFPADREAPDSLAILEYDPAALSAAEWSQVIREAPCSLLIAVDFQRLGNSEWALRELCVSESIIEGVIDTSRDVQFYFPIIRGSLGRVRLFGPETGIRGIGETLNRLVASTLNELQRVKKLHERLVPLRQDHVKGLSVHSKFAAGETSGGEFFDMVKDEQSVLFIASSSRSYVASSIILSHFEVLRGKKQIGVSQMEEFLEALTCELRDLELIDRDRFDLVQLVVANVDLKTMRIDGYHFGNFQLHSLAGGDEGNQYPLNENFFDKARFTRTFQRAEKLVLLSPGVILNANGKLGGMDVAQYVRSQMPNGAKIFLTELFFQLKRDLTREFLQYDASAIFIEVDPHVIVQV
jgi:hypothetical protein